MKMLKIYHKVFQPTMVLLLTAANLSVPALASPQHVEELQRLRAGDELIIALPGVPREQSSYIIDFHGVLKLPVVGLIKAAGLQITEVEKSIFQSLPVYLTGSTLVKVEILVANYFIRLSGHVANPGWYRVPLYYDLEQAMELAGGALDGAVLSGIKILRSDSSGVLEIPVDYFQYISTGDRLLLPRLRQKDTIFIPQSTRFGDVKRSLGHWFPPKSELEVTIADQIRVLGEVKHPSFIEPVPGANVLDLIILAGGPSRIADMSRVKLYRDNDGLTVHFEVDIATLLESENLHRIAEVLPGDIIIVPSIGQSFISRTWNGFRDNASTISTLVFMVTAINQLTRGK